jgi:hypothetical protein
MAEFDQLKISFCLSLKLFLVMKYLGKSYHINSIFGEDVEDY